MSGQKREVKIKSESPKEPLELELVVGETNSLEEEFVTLYGHVGPHRQKLLCIRERGIWAWRGDEGSEDFKAVFEALKEVGIPTTCDAIKIECG